MRKPFLVTVTPIVLALILLAGCDSGGVTEGIPKDASAGAAPVMPGGNLKSTKEIAKEGRAAKAASRPVAKDK